MFAHKLNINNNNKHIGKCSLKTYISGISMFMLILYKTVYAQKPLKATGNAQI